MGKCSKCGALVAYPFRCNYCGRLFCDEHRLPEGHECPTLKTAKQAIAK